MKDEKGITIIALVITIVVMLILLGITIGSTLNSGLINIAKNSRRETKRGVGEEQNGVTAATRELDNVL